MIMKIHSKFQKLNILVQALECTLSHCVCWMETGEKQEIEKRENANNKKVED